MSAEPYTLALHENQFERPDYNGKRMSFGMKLQDDHFLQVMGSALGQSVLDFPFYNTEIPKMSTRRSLVAVFNIPHAIENVIGLIFK